MIPTFIGEGFEGSGASAAHVKSVLGDRYGPVGTAWVTALATPSHGHTPFVVVARPGLPVKPLTLMVNTATYVSREQVELTWGAAQAGVAAGILDAVSSGVVASEHAETGLLIVSVWVDPGASSAHQDVIYINNRAATLAALTAGSAGRPTVAEVLGDTGGIWNAFYQP